MLADRKNWAEKLPSFCLIVSVSLPVQGEGARRTAGFQGVTMFPDCAYHPTMFAPSSRPARSFAPHAASVSPSPVGRERAGVRVSVESHIFSAVTSAPISAHNPTMQAARKSGRANRLA